MGLTRVAVIDGEAILPLVDAKLHLKVDTTADDDLIGALRDAAIDHVERVSGIALASADFQLTRSSFPSTGPIELPIGPVTDLGTITYYNSDGDSTTFSAARLIEGSVYPNVSATWPIAYDYVAIEFTAGLSDPALAPGLLAAVRLVLGHLYENRQEATEKALTALPLGVRALIHPYSEIRI